MENTSRSKMIHKRLNRKLFINRLSRKISIKFQKNSKKAKTKESQMEAKVLQNIMISGHNTYKTNDSIFAKREDELKNEEPNEKNIDCQQNKKLKINKKRKTPE